MKMRTWLTAVVTAIALSGMGGAAFAAPAPPAVREPATSPEPNPDSKRMERAKAYFADEQWARAIAEFQAVVDDAREPNRDVALFWLAQSEYEGGDLAAAIQAIARLERQYPASPWVRFARSLRVEIAQRLNRVDVLEAVAWPTPPAPPAPPRPGVAPVPPGAPPAPVPPVPASTTPRPPRPPMAPIALPAHPGATPAPPPAPPAPAAPPTPPGPSPRVRTAPPPTFFRPPAAPPAPGAEYFLPTPYPDDMDVKILALSALMDAHGDRVIPLLREIALDTTSPDDGRRATIVLAQSSRPEARIAVADVARRGAEPVRIVAIREMGRFEGPSVSTELMQVYFSSPTPRVKRQIVSSLGERADNVSLLRIASAESDPTVRNTAIVTLGHLPNAQPQLRTLYVKVPQESRMALLSALLTSKDEDELIRIARTEREPLFRQRARLQLRMLGTPKALKFLDENP